MTWACPASSSVEYILTNPGPDTATMLRNLARPSRIRSTTTMPWSSPSIAGSRASGRAPRPIAGRGSNGTFEGFYREDNGQSDPGITSLYDFPTNDPSYTAHRRAAVRLPGRHPLPRRAWQGSAATGSSARVQALRQLRGDRQLRRRHRVQRVSSGKPLTRACRQPELRQRRRNPARPRAAPASRPIDGFKTRTPFEYPGRRAGQLRRPFRRAPLHAARRRVQPVQPESHRRLRRVDGDHLRHALTRTSVSRCRAWSPARRSRARLLCASAPVSSSRSTTAQIWSAPS